MKKILGMLIILVVIMAATALAEPKFLSANNLSLILLRTSLFAIIGIGVAFVIITGGIDLSIGSLMALVAVTLCMLLEVELKAPDHYPVARILVAEKSIIADVESTSLQAGDTVIFKGGRRYLSKGFSISGSGEGGKRLQIEAAPANDDSGGTLTKLHAIKRIGSAELGPIPAGEEESEATREKRRMIYAEGDYSWLEYDDKLVTYEGEKYREASFLVTASTFDGSETAVEVRSEIDPGFSADFFVPFKSSHMPVWLAIGISLGVAAGAGLIHGLFVTKVGLQPFVVTLCGFLVYRGIARAITEDQNQSLGNFYESAKVIGKGTPAELPVPGLEHLQYALMSNLPWQKLSDEEIIKQAENLAKGDDPASGEVALDFISWIPIASPVLIMAVIAIMAIVLLRFTVIGRYLMALGNNEKAARYSGINTHRLTILAYVISASMAGVMGVVYIFKFNVIQPNTGGSLYELYAIAAAVLGGCSLRGGKGSIVGVIIGAAVMFVLYNAINLVGFKTQWEPAIIGGVLLLSVTVDELVRKFAARRRTAVSASAP